MAAITVELSEDLASRLQQYSGQLPKLLEFGLREMNASTAYKFTGAAEIMEFLAGLPSPEEILKLRPSEELQARIDALLEKNRKSGLSQAEEQEWEQYEYLEHIVRLAKGKAAAKLQSV